MSIKSAAKTYIDEIVKRDALISRRTDEQDNRDSAIAKINELTVLIAAQRDVVQAAKDALVAEIAADGAG